MPRSLLSRIILAFAILALAALPAASQDRLELPEPQACPAVEGLKLAPAEESGWSPCEKWVWSCIRKGHEANLFAKQCVEPRTGAASALRAQSRYAPFHEPDRYKDTNLIGGRFLYSILTKQDYASEIDPVGIRLVGAYFAELVNLENVTTDKNLVFDQSIFKRGLRLTNFKTEKNLSLDGSNVRDRIYLLRASIGGTLFMEEGVYDLVDAADARFGASIDAPSSVFNAPFRLDRVKVEGKVSFIRTRLTELTAWDTSIGSKLELRYAHVRGRVDLTGTHVQGDLRIQRMQFGRALGDDAPLYCDWDLHDTERFFLNPDLPAFQARPDLHAAIVREAILTRPVGIGARPEYPCLKIKDQRTGELSLPRDTHHEVLLRDMKIGGALCLIDLTGEIAPAPTPGARRHRHVTSIALDGTDARSTIIRWKDSPSDTLWQAVHFKTKNLFIDLGSRPRRHFLDNLEIGNISFIRPGGEDKAEQVEESRAYLCDIRPGPGARFESDSPDTHRRIVEFFKSEGNLARSPQPFGEIVARLNDSNSSSLMLKMELSEYKLGKVCASSDYFKTPNGGGPGSTGPVAGGELATALDHGAAGGYGPSLDETRKILLDAACLGGLKAYKYSVAYGHQPHNIVLLMALFVVAFRFALLFDTRRPEAEQGRRTPQLGILYSVDMFTPFVKLNPQHSELRPNRRALRAYLVFHRVVGLVLTTFLVIGIYAARF